jgi:hypothetical protein
MNQVETIWLASQLSLLFCYCADDSAQSSSVFQQVWFIVFMLYGEGHSFSHLMYFMLQKVVVFDYKVMSMLSMLFELISCFYYWYFIL